MSEKPSLNVVHANFRPECESVEDMAANYAKLLKEREDKPTRIVLVEVFEDDSVIAYGWGDVQDGYTGVGVLHAGIKEILECMQS